MTANAPLLIVEDDTDLRDFLHLAATQRSYRTMQARNGLEALELLTGHNIPSLVILDITMPGMDGLEFCRKLRNRHPAIPVIFLSARTEEYEKIQALEIGGDDYLTKPFSVRELFTRVEVALRRVEVFSKRHSESTSQGTVRSGFWVLHPDAWTCSFQGTEVLLTVSEYRILWRLMDRPGVVVNREDLARTAFPEDFYNTGRSVDTHIHRIRRKLRRVDPDFGSIKTVYQVGYKWTD